MNGLLGFLVLIITLMDVIAILFIINNKKISKKEKFQNLLLVLFLPVIGAWNIFTAVESKDYQSESIDNSKNGDDSRSMFRSSNYSTTGDPNSSFFGNSSSSGSDGGGGD